MYTANELLEITQESWFEKAIKSVRQLLLERRLGLEDHDSVSFIPTYLKHLSYFSGLVLGSVGITNEDVSQSEWKQLCHYSADIEYLLFIIKTKNENLRRAGILYELAELPGVAASMMQQSIGGGFFNSFLSRSNGFGRLDEGWKENELHINREGSISSQAIEETLSILSEYMQTFVNQKLDSSVTGMKILLSAAKNFNLDITGDECAALLKIINKRGKASVSKFIPKELQDDMKIVGLPAELWPVQQNAIKGGLLSKHIISWGLASPTGTGKTSIAQMLLVAFFSENPTKKAFYIVPSRALAAQVANDLDKTLKPLGIKVGALGSHLTFHENIAGNPMDMDVLVFTPEKADLIMRVEPELLKDTELVIVDEAHHIEMGFRGILLEFYLWRLRALIPSSCRVVQLSAVAPNISELVDWLAPKELTNYVKQDWRTGRLRIGLYERGSDASGVLEFEGMEQIVVQAKGEVPFDSEKSIATLADKLSKRGTVLILASSPKQAENIASEIFMLRADKNNIDLSSHSIERLDSRLERELYSEVPLRKYFPKGIVYHHAQLPHRVRAAVEQVISERKANIVCATTTLAEGVNFPFSTVLVESLLVGGVTLSPRGLWNIAGRAGRFGVDSEGLCILFRPSIWRDKLVGYELEDYLKTNLDAIPPVRSALATSLGIAHEAVHKDLIKLSDIEAISLNNLKDQLPKETAKIVRSLVNMLRVGLTHAHTNKLINVKDVDSTIINKGIFAYAQLTKGEETFAKEFEKSQRRVISSSLDADETLLRIAAKIGWTLETQESLWKWIKSLDNWQIEGFGNLVRGGSVPDSDKLKYLLSPVATRMAEFDGSILGGFTSFISQRWIEGLPLSSIRESSISEGRQVNSYDRLVKTIYSKIQYLLPWALFGVDDLMSYEAKIRNISFGSGVKDLSTLSSEGVPNFDALNLVMTLDLERVDATRLARSYRRTAREVDIISWFRDLPWSTVAGIVSGSDKRRLDSDLKIIHENLG